MKQRPKVNKLVTLLYINSTSRRGVEVLTTEVPIFRIDCRSV